MGTPGSAGGPRKRTGRKGQHRASGRPNLAAGKTPLAALRCLKRRLSDVIYRQLVADARKASPGGQTGATLTSSAAGPTPTADSSDKPLPEPAPTTLPPPGLVQNPPPASAQAAKRRVGAPSRRRDRPIDIEGSHVRELLRGAACDEGRATTLCAFINLNVVRWGGLQTVTVGDVAVVRA